MLVEIKSFYSDWKLVEEHQAIAFITAMLNGMSGRPSTTKKQYINEKCLRGVTVEELLSRSNNSKST